jgi:hypothetical protein
MTASGGREVDAKPLSGAALGSAQTRPNAQDACGQDLGQLVEALGGRHEVGVESVGHSRSALDCTVQRSRAYQASKYFPDHTRR